MTHIFTRMRRADDCWIKGIGSMIRASGGGRLHCHRRGVDVLVHNPDKFIRLMDWDRARLRRIATLRRDIQDGRYTVDDPHKIHVVAARIHAAIMGS